MTAFCFLRNHLRVLSQTCAKQLRCVICFHLQFSNKCGVVDVGPFYAHIHCLVAKNPHPRPGGWGGGQRPKKGLCKKFHVRWCADVPKAALELAQAIA